MKHRRVAAGATLVVAAVVGAAVTLTVSGVAQSAPSSSAPRLSTVTVVRTDLVTSVLTAGTLGYGESPPVVNQSQGTYTALAAPGSTVGRGDVLYRVDNVPVVLMIGAVPAWRAFTPGMSDGPDVAQLESNLIALGDADGLFSAASDHYSDLTTAAVERWQQGLGVVADGTVALGDVVFLPGPVRVAGAQVVLGQPATPAQQPLDVTTTTRAVTVPLSPLSPTVTVEEPVSIVLPSTATVPATVTALDPPPPASTQSPSSSDSGGGGQPPVSAVAIVTPSDAAATGIGDAVAVQVSLTTQEARGVLAVPISALLALSEGGYALEVVGPGGRHHLVAVTTGVFTATQVQVEGNGVEAGTKVVTAQ